MEMPQKLKVKGVEPKVSPKIQASGGKLSLF